MSKYNEEVPVTVLVTHLSVNINGSWLNNVLNTYGLASLLNWVPVPLHSPGPAPFSDPSLTLQI
jgi:hypothetical protein